MRSRLTSVAMIAALFLVLAAGSPFGQSSIEDRVFTSHGGNVNLLSRIDPITDVYVGSKDMPAEMKDIFPHTSKLNPTWLVAASATGSGLYRLSTNQGVVDKIVNTQGFIKAAQHVNSPPLVPHYVVAEDYNGTTSSAMIEFLDIDGASVNETFVTGSTGDTFTDVCFTHTDVGLDLDPTNDYYRWWFSNLSPTGSPTDSVWVLDLNYNDILMGEPNDPFNTNPILPGPPFPKILTQLDANLNRWKQMALLASNDDPRMRAEAWFDTATSTNYTIFFRTHFHPGPTPFYETHVSVFNADGTVPGGAVAEIDSNDGLAGGSTPIIFHQVAVVGNYAIVTEGANVSSSGGTQTTFIFLPELADGTADGDTGVRGSVILMGCDGVGTDVDDMKVYVGTDETNNYVWMIPTLPATVSGGKGLILDSGVGTLPVVVAGIKTITLLTDLEQNMVNPPNRTYPGRATVSFRIQTDPVLTFPGQGTPNGSSKVKRECSAGAMGGTVWTLSLLALLIGVGGLFLRK